MSTVTLVNCFQVPQGREQEFFSLWQQVNTYMRGKKGYLEHKLHRSLAPDANFRFRQYIMFIDENRCVTMLDVMTVEEGAYYDHRTYDDRRADQEDKNPDAKAQVWRKK